MPSLVQPLFAGPLDLVGDVHGEINALRSLLARLGYDAEGRHRDGRRLVFLGDLTDRGPDSPAVVDLVEALVTSGQAQCVLGNHDLNILLEHRKYDNNWFYGEEFREGGYLVPQVLADEAIRQRVLNFFGTLPVALERDDLRVVHASWLDETIATARYASDVLELYHYHHNLIESSFPGLDLDTSDQQLRHQNENPVKTLTSGPEVRAKVAVVVHGEERYEERVRWWETYRGPYCVFGHYSIHDGKEREGEAAFCIDYGVGKRWTERRDGKSKGFSLRLGALRWPERVVVFDEG